MIICGHFHDYWWESYDYLCRVWGLYVGLLMIIFGEAGEMLIIFCGVCGHFDDNFWGSRCNVDYLWDLEDSLRIFLIILKSY